MSFISRFAGDTSLVVNPYELPFVKRKRQKEKYVKLLKFLLVERQKQHTELNLRQILISKAVEADIRYPELLPDNVRLATFAQGLKPLVVVYKPAVFEKQEALGSSYLGNIALWKELLDKERAGNYLDVIRDYHDARFDKIRMIDEPVVYVDSADAFVKSVLDRRKDRPFDNLVSEKVHRYFRYLSYLPLVFNNMASCLIFVEVIDRLEVEIAASLKLKRPLELFRRMKPDSKLYLDYLERFGLEHTVREDSTTSQCS